MKKSLAPALTALLAGLLIAGCSSTPISSTPSGAAAVEDRNTSAAASGVPSSSIAKVNTGGIPGGVSGSGAGQPVTPIDLRGVPSQRSVFFDYDSFSIKPEFKTVIEAHARFLVSNPRAKTLVQGNTDERGSREYNLALGQKRADVVKQSLMLLGVREDQIESVSLGEEKPKNAGRDDAAYAENRRSDVLYAGEY